MLEEASLRARAWCLASSELPVGTQGPKVRNLGRPDMPLCAGEIQNHKASGVSWRQDGRVNASPAEQVRVSELCVWFNFRHQADL